MTVADARVALMQLPEKMNALVPAEIVFPHAPGSEYPVGVLQMVALPLEVTHVPSVYVVTPALVDAQYVPELLATMVPEQS